MTSYATPRDEWPSRAEAAAEPPLVPMPPTNRAALVAELAALQAPITRCSVRHCRATVDLEDDPRALMECCGEVVCSGCEHVCEADR